MPKRTVAVVYWLYDERCVCPWRHGYIGTTVTWPRRLYRHRTESEFPSDTFQGQVLFRGTVKQCLKLETEMRPRAQIGWNTLPGGLGGFAGKGVPKSAEHKENIRQAALRRYSNPAEHVRTSKAVKRGLKNVDRTGANNPSYGKPMAEDTKQKVRDRIAERGGVSGKNNPNYK